MPSISISVVIPVYNGGRNFQKCLSSIRQSDRQPDELIVVSDGDTDGSWRIAEYFGAQVLRLPPIKGEPGGPARARNCGAKQAQGDILFFMDADVTLHSDTLNLIEQQFLAQPNLAALIGSYDENPGEDNFLSQYKNLFHHYTHQVSSETASTFWGACGAIRRPVFLALGGFDESYKKPCIEDIELGYRLTRAGYSVRLYKDIQVKHLKRWEVRSLLQAEIFYRALPWTTLMLRDRSINADLNLSYTNRLSVIFIFALISSLAFSSVFHWLLIVAILLGLGLLLLNINVYCFFYRKRGIRFTLKVIPWHWFYFLYGGTTFVYATLKYIFDQLTDFLQRLVCAQPHR